MTIDELCQKAGTEICHQVFQSDRWKWKDEDDLAAILKPFFAEAWALAMEEAAAMIENVDYGCAQVIRRMAAAARKEGGTC